MSRNPSGPGRREPTVRAHRLLAVGGPGHVFAARGRDLTSDQLQEETRHV